jgi:hypothetical protein
VKSWNTPLLFHLAAGKYVLYKLAYVQIVMHYVLGFLNRAVEGVFMGCECQAHDREGHHRACQMYMHKEHFVHQRFLVQNRIDFVEVSLYFFL